MEKINLLLGYFERQSGIIDKLYSDVKDIDLDRWENQYVFALKTQQLYTAIEDLMKTVARTFENSVEDHSKYHFELLKVMTSTVPNIRPAVLSEKSYLLLDKVRSFRHFIRHGYNYELDKDELLLLQDKLKKYFPGLQHDLSIFTGFLQNLIK